MWRSRLFGVVLEPYVCSRDIWKVISITFCALTLNREFCQLQKVQGHPKCYRLQSVGVTGIGVQQS